jgi:hypothetical protein
LPSSGGVAGTSGASSSDASVDAGSDGSAATTRDSGENGAACDPANLPAGTYALTLAFTEIDTDPCNGSEQCCASQACCAPQSNTDRVELPATVTVHSGDGGAGYLSLAISEESQTALVNFASGQGLVLQFATQFTYPWPPVRANNVEQSSGYAFCNASFGSDGGGTPLAIYSVWDCSARSLRFVGGCGMDLYSDLCANNNLELDVAAELPIADYLHCGDSTRCAPDCYDRAENGTETDVDCGGTCAPCADHDKCAVGSDCASGVCAPPSTDAHSEPKLCQVSTCSDRVANGNETDVDCGGSCPRCADGQRCNGPGSCQSQVCTGGRCAEPGICGIDCMGTCTSTGCVVTLVSSVGAQSNLAVNGSSLYWTGGAIMSVPLAGGTPTTVVPAQDGAQNVVLDGTNVYWTIDEPSPSGAVRSAALSGGAVTPIASSQDSPDFLAVDGANVYWGGLTTIRKAPLGGGGPTTMLASSQKAPRTIVVDDASVYWSAASAGAIMKVGKDGSGLTALISGQTSPYGLALDSTNIYWTSGASVMKAHLDGSGAVPLAPNEAGPLNIAIDGTNVYFTSPGNGSGGTVKKVPIAGGTATVLASGHSPTCVYRPS